MPQLDIVEQAFIAAVPALVAAQVRGGTPARTLWPGLAVRVDEDRGLEGQRYLVADAGARVPGARRGALTGTAEIWLAPVVDGVLAHVFLRADPTPPAVWSPRLTRRRQEHWRRHIRQALWAIKDDLEYGRRPGEPAAGGPSNVVPPGG